ncbi:autophagy-related protein 17, partial [Desulforhabdus sp. TSK]|uniref:autophagy-related protein 17 n=1 Tax=Desulforhabdus sp. TSK TaxID=2925014 RepID=UPI001FC8D0F0
MLDVVVGDASEVEGVVYEITDRLRTVEEAFATLTERVNHSTKAHAAAINTLHMLEDIGGRLAGYMAAEAEFLQRWEDEHMTIYSKLDEMEALRVFYQGYAGAYDAVLLEAERRRVTEEKMSAIWRRAKDS